MAQPGQARGLTGFLDALRADGSIIGWARDMEDATLRPTIRLMRGAEVLAECVATARRDDGNPGFRLVAAPPPSAADFLEGRLRVQAVLPGRHAPTTLAMTPRMRAALEAAAGVAPSVAPPAAPPPAVKPDVAGPLGPMQALADRLHAAGIPALHLLVPGREAMLGTAPDPRLLALEARAAALPLLARDWVPLRQAFARDGAAQGFWREDGARLSVAGCLALLDTVLLVLRYRFPQAAPALGRAEALLARAEPTGELPAELFADLPPPQPLGTPAPGVEAWRNLGAPLPWRVVLLAAPGLGGSADAAAPGWWLRQLVAECVLSEALERAPAAAVVEAAPDLVLTLATAGR